MKLNGLIYEKVGNPEFFEGSEYFIGGGFVLLISGSSVITLYKQIEDFYGTIALGGVWVSNETENAKFIDIFRTGYTYTDLNFGLFKAVNNVSNKLICDDIQNSNILILDPDDWSYKALPYDGLATISVDKKDIFIRFLYPSRVVSYNLEFNKKWEYEINGDHYLDFELKPLLHNDLVIINHAYDTIALNKYTGEEVWKYTFEDIPTSNVLMEGKIYAVCSTILYVLDPNTGKVEWSKETGYAQYLPDVDGSISTTRNQIGIFPVGDYLYGVAHWAEQGEIIRLFDNDFNLLYKTRLVDYGIHTSMPLLPGIHNGKIYQRLRNSYSYSDTGVLVLEMTENESEAGIRVATRPDVTMMASPSLSESHKLQVFLDATSLDDALRYGPLLVEELFFATGYFTMYDLRKNALDRLHNGDIELIIDDSVFTDSDKGEYLKQLGEKLVKSPSNHMKRAGDKKTPINFKLVLQSKQDWDMSGEQLDWPAIRDQETPLI